MSYEGLYVWGLNLEPPMLDPGNHSGRHAPVVGAYISLRAYMPLRAYMHQGVCVLLGSTSSWWHTCRTLLEAKSS